MSIEPFFRDEPLLRDQPPDTRKDATTTQPVDDELYGADTPPTYAMGLAEQLAAFAAEGQRSSVGIVLRPEGVEGPFELPTITLDDFDADIVLDDFEDSGEFDRQTLPSAPYPSAILDDAAAALAFDVPPNAIPSIPHSELILDPPSDPAPSEEPDASIWGKLHRFVTGISKSRSQAPVSSTSSTRISQRAIFDLVWTLDNASLDALSLHIDRVLAVRRLGPDAYAETRIVDTLDSLMESDRHAADGISLATLRARMPEVARAMFDHALLRLENRGIVALFPDELGHDGIMDPVRGHLSRCVLLQTAD